MAGPSDRERRTEGREASGLGEAYRKAAPYMGASTSLVIAVGVFTGVGIWLDRKLGNRVPWFTMIGALLGMVGGFVSFFRTVIRKKP